MAASSLWNAVELSIPRHLSHLFSMVCRYDAAADTASDAYVGALHGKDKVVEGAGEAADQAKQQVCRGHTHPPAVLLH
jgi:DNA-directed RNA polymerase specialized sigma24 family protein